MFTLYQRYFDSLEASSIAIFSKQATRTDTHVSNTAITLHVLDMSGTAGFGVPNLDLWGY